MIRKNKLLDRAEKLAGIGGFVPFNEMAHQYTSHPNRKVVYTSATTLDTTAGPRWYPSFDKGIKIVSVSLNVQVGPTAGALTWDLLIFGTSAFTVTGARPGIAQNVVSGPPAYPNLNYVPPGGYVQMQGVTNNSATGPLVATIEYVQVGR